MTINYETIFSTMRKAIDAAGDKERVLTIHLQVIKYEHLLVRLAGREIAEGLTISESYGTEIAKARRLAPRLVDAGLDVDKL